MGDSIDEWVLHDAESVLKETFNRLRDEWKAESAFTSSITEKAMASPYQQIIGMGSEVVPLILKELGDDLDHWFWALAAITRANPVPTGARGELDRMRTAWLAWGQEHGMVQVSEGE